MTEPKPATPEINRQITKSLAKFLEISVAYEFSDNFINQVIYKLHSLEVYKNSMFGLYVSNAGQWVTLFDGLSIKDVVLKINNSTIEKSRKFVIDLNKHILNSTADFQILDVRKDIYKQNFQAGWGFPILEFQRQMLLSSNQSAYKKEIFYIKKAEENIFTEASKARDCRYYKKEDHPDGGLYEVFFTNYKQLFLLGMQFNKEKIKLAAESITNKLFEHQILDTATTKAIISNQIIQS